LPLEVIWNTRSPDVDRVLEVLVTVTTDRRPSTAGRPE
jgi:hypothetical protein